MSVSVETDLGTNLAQEGGFSLAENRGVAPAAWLLQVPPAQPTEWPRRRGWMKLPFVERSGAGPLGRAPRWPRFRWPKPH